MNGYLNVDITLSDVRNDGNSLTLQVNGVDHMLPIEGKRANLVTLGEGSNTLVLTNPAGCVQQKMVQCP